MIQYWEPVSGWLHFLSALASLFGLIVLNYLSAKHGTWQHFWTNAVFMSSMLLLYSASAVYHIIPHDYEWKKVFRRIDQAMIYFLIAGTFTPLGIIALKNDGGPYLLTGMWIVAFVGATLKLANKHFPQVVQTSIYLGMGWVGVLKINVLFDVFGEGLGFWLFLGGGIAYTVGAFFYMIEDRYDPKGKYWIHEIFHLLVMIGSACHYWLMQEYLLGI